MEMKISRGIVRGVIDRGAKRAVLNSARNIGEGNVAYRWCNKTTNRVPDSYMNTVVHTSDSYMIGVDSDLPAYRAKIPYEEEHLRQRSIERLIAMDKWHGKIAVVTGASSGIGEAIAIALLEQGVNVVGLARRLERMRMMANKMKGAKGTFHPVRCDVRKEEEIQAVFQFVETLGGVSILVNNAGLGFKELISEGSTENMRNILDVNLLASAICTRETIKSLRKHGVPGHIIYINSTTGHNPNVISIPASLYEVSKFGITAMAEVLRREVRQMNIPVRITSLSPGLVKTEMPILHEAGGEKLFRAVPHVEGKDIADGTVYVLSTPPNVQVDELTITAIHSRPLTLEK